MSRQNIKKSIFSVGCVLAFVAFDVCADQNPESGQPSQESMEPTQLQQQGGMRAYIDPATGELTSPTPEQTRARSPLSFDEQNAMSTSHDGLYVEEGDGGEMKVDLQGRFQNSVFATVNESGEVSVSHDRGTAGEKQPVSSGHNHQQQGE